jgi:hypothetical protein
MGRRNLLLMGAVGMAVCQFIVAITGTVAGVTDLAAQQAAIAFVCIYIFFCELPISGWTQAGTNDTNNKNSRQLMGPGRLGRYGRVVPVEGPREVSFHGKENALLSQQEVRRTRAQS